MEQQQLPPHDYALQALYDNLLEHETPYLESLKAGALRSREGISTGLILKSRTAQNDVTDLELCIPKHAITMVCARTGGGKTTFMADLTKRMVLGGATGFFVTLEEPDHAITAKLLASYTMTKHKNHSLEALTVGGAMDVIAGVKTCPDFDDFKKHIIRKVRVIDANKAVDFDRVETPSIMYQPQYIADLIKFRNAKSEKPLDFVVIDFCQLMETSEADNSSSYLRLKAVMQAMKNLCGHLGIAVVMGAQLQRSCFSIPVWNWEPEMIRDGSDIEQAASLVIAIGNDKDYHDKKRNTAIRFMKNRCGPQRVAGMFDIDFAHCHVPSNGAEPTNDA